MTQSFDDFYEENKDVFDPCVWRSAEKAFKAGAQSKQAEIDELQKEIDSYKCIYGKLELERDELRKRIDLAIEQLESDSEGFTGLVYNYDEALLILKGTTNEQ